MANDNADTTPEQSGDAQGQNQQANSQSGEGESTAQNQDGETVTIEKGKYEELNKKAEQAEEARNMQSIADKEKRKAQRKLKKMEKAFQNSDINVSDGSDTGGNLDTFEEYTPEERKQIADKAEKGVLQKIVDNPEYREVLDNDPTLNDIVKRNPLALIDEYIDAEDAVEQITNKLDNRVSNMKDQDTAQQNTGTEQGGGEQTPKKEVSTKGAGAGASGRQITPEQASSMSQEEYTNLPQNVRQKLLDGETVTLQ